MAGRGAAVAHCPLSNFYFGDGLFCVARALAYGVKVGLGTDVAGGYSPSMLQAMRMAVINSHALKAAALMAQQQRELQQQQQQQQQEEQQEQQQARTHAQSGESQPLAAVPGQHNLQKQDEEKPAEDKVVGQMCRRDVKCLSDSQPHGAAAGEPLSVGCSFGCSSGPGLLWESDWASSSVQHFCRTGHTLNAIMKFNLVAHGMLCMRSYAGPAD
jgi:hypothetical protein